jgi:DNA-directed RNA polymerase subunit RPC12/RpoP
MSASAGEREAPQGAVAGAAPKSFPCPQCGALVEFAPGRQSLRCAYCSHEIQVPQGEGDIRELDFHAYLGQAGAREETVERLTVKCPACGAESTAAANVSAQQCPFCDTSIVSTAATSKAIKPKALLPFQVKQEEARESYRKWIGGLWFAPGALKKRAQLEIGIAGIYIPFWTYDANTTCFYTGERGDHYYVTERRTRKDSGGKTVEVTERVRKTRWTHARGTVWNSFDDVLIPASRSLPDNLARALEPWDLKNLVPYQDAYLAGFKAESYQVDLEQGFVAAKAVMDSAIRASVCRDIGGDEQRIATMKTAHDGVTFKHVLLPVWLSAYRFKDKVYRFMVNARTGEAQGERPWSSAKIAAAILAVAGAVAAIVGLSQHFQ